MSRTTRRSRLSAATAVVALLAPAGVLAVPAVALADTGPGIFANPGETVTVEFPYRAEQYEWVVPEGVTEITVELAAGSGASPVGDDGVTAAGGAGGYATVQVPVLSGETLLLRIGASGATSDRAAGDGGTGSALARATGLVAVAGGGGGAFTCLVSTQCGNGGAGGLSHTSGGLNGGDSTWSDAVPLEIALRSVGGGASDTAAGSPGEYEQLDIFLGALTHRVTVGSAPATPAAAASVQGGIVQLSPAGQAATGRDGIGGTGLFTGGTGGESVFLPSDDEPLGAFFVAGGGGGSGYLAPGVDLLALRDNLGDGFATITYTVPEPDVVDAFGAELTLGQGTVRAGETVALSGSGFDPDRDYPVILHSDPVLLGTATTDATGAFTATLLVPTTVPPGEHVITVGDASIPITVLAAGAAVGGDERTVFLADAPPPQPELAATGTETTAASILGLLAVSLLGAGAAAVRASRQPHRVRQPRSSRLPTPARRATTPAR